MELISENIANTSTPGFKARDLDFGVFIENAQNQNSEIYQLTQATSTRDDDLEFEKSITFHQPLTKALMVTSEIGVEQAKFGKAVADYEAAMGFLENRIAETESARGIRMSADALLK